MRVAKSGQNSSDIFLPRAHLWILCLGNPDRRPQVVIDVISTMEGDHSQLNNDVSYITGDRGCQRQAIVKASGGPQGEIIYSLEWSPKT